MDVSYIQHGCFFSPRNSTHPATPKLCPIHRRGLCFASSDTLLTSSRREEGSTPVIDSKKVEEFVDLKAWMHGKGLLPCKVELRDKPLHYDQTYVIANEDLQVGDVAFTVPNSLVVTLERVLGNEQIAAINEVLFA